METTPLTLTAPAPTPEPAEDDFEDRRRRSFNPRKYVDGCSTCDGIKARGGFGPYHDAGSGCESGFYSHCSCDSCF